MYGKEIHHANSTHKKTAVAILYQIKQTQTKSTTTQRVQEEFHNYKRIG